MSDPAPLLSWRFCIPLRTSLHIALLSFAAPLLCVAQISGIVHDPSGAPIAHASVELAPAIGASLTSSTDDQGHFHFDRLAAGSYRLTGSHAGLEDFTQSVDLGAKPVELSIALKLASINTSITVTSGTLRNSDPNYQALRKGQLQDVWRVNNLVLKRDVATFTFRSGSFSFLPPVLGRVSVAVFTGDGNLKLVRNGAPQRTQRSAIKR
jgi:hypothetical protein